jgi:hypothetical protein
MIVKGLKKCYTSDEMNGNSDDKEGGYAGSEPESLISECETEDGIYEDTEPETGHGNGKLSGNDEAK